MDIGGYKIRPSKHFMSTWMRKWDYDIYSIRRALEDAHKVEKMGKDKYEAYIRAKGRTRKIVFVKDDEYKEIFVITGAE